MLIESMSGADLVELSGREVDRMGFSLKKITRPLSRAAGVVKRNAGNALVYATAVPTGGASLLAKKKVRNFAKRNVGNAVIYTTVPVTGGWSLLGKKKVRDAAGRLVRSTTHNVIRPLAKNADVQRIVSNAIRDLPGGNTILDLIPKRKKKKEEEAPAEEKKIMTPALAGIGAIGGLLLLSALFSKKSKPKG